MTNRSSIFENSDHALDSASVYKACTCSGGLVPGYKFPSEGEILWLVASANRLPCYANLQPKGIVDNDTSAMCLSCSETEYHFPLVRIF